VNWLLDTVTVSELRREHPDRGLTAWVSGQNEHRLHVSAVSLLEIEIGVRRKERSDPRQGAMLRRWLDEKVRPGFAGRILPFDDAAARAAAAMHVPNPAPVHDAMIAGIAIARGLTVVTRNVRDFDSLGARLVNPWDA
jgi:toxin FitB